MSDVPVAVFGIGYLGAIVTMILHLGGVLAGWWTADGITWTIPLVFILISQLGAAMDE